MIKDNWTILIYLSLHIINNFLYIEIYNSHINNNNSSNKTLLKDKFKFKFNILIYCIEFEISNNDL